MSADRPVFTTDPSDFLAVPSWSKYDPVLSLAIAELTSVAYRGKDVFEELALAAGWDQARFLESGASQAGVVILGGLAVVVCPGTQEFGDIRDDLRIWRVAWPEIFGCGAGGPCPRVCVGFKRQVQRLIPELEKCLEELFPGEFPTVVIGGGHSLGGPVAIFLMAWAHRSAHEVEAVYTHEMPRPGNRGLRDAWADTEIPMFREVMISDERQAMDLVTRVPPRRLGYRHVGTPSIHVYGTRLTSEAEWQRLRAEHPRGLWQTLRVVSRTYSALQVHALDTVIDRLRIQAGRA